MALPAGITTFTLSFGPYTDAQGVVTVEAPATARLFPVDPATGARIKLTHLASGQVIVPSNVRVHVNGETGIATVGPLPHTDQAGLSMVGFAYRVEWDIASSKPSPGDKTFAVPAAKGASADFDLLEVSDTPGILVPVVTGATGPAGPPGNSADATTTTKGAVQLAGDLGGTAAAPTVPGLANKVNTSTYTAGLAAKANTADLAAVAQSGSYNDLANKPTIPTASPSHANTFALLGTSITTFNEPYNQGGGVFSLRGNGYWYWANAALRQSARLVLQAGVSGDTTGGMLARVSAATASGARFLVVEPGPNDVQGDSTFANITSALTGIFTAGRAAGMLVAACHICPTGTIASVPSRLAVMFAVNRWINEYASRNPGIIVVPWAAPMSDPTTGGPLSGTLQPDNIHPNTRGAAIMGNALADALAPYIVGIDDLPYSNGDPGNLIGNGLLLGGTTTATGWTWGLGTGAAATFSKVPRLDGDPGEWQQISITTGQAYGRSPLGTTGWSPGDVVYADIEVDGDLTAATQLEMQVLALDSGQSTLAAGLGLTDYYTSAGRVPMSRAVVRTQPITIPASGTASLQILFMVAGAVTARVSRAAIRKVVTA